MIGRGAVGRVYLATQICLDREVAIKILHPSYVNHSEALARFRLEACAVSRLSHPGIVTVFDWGHDEYDLFYLAIEYLPGVDLFEIAQKEAPIPAARIARLMEQVARALSHAHAQGIIHRDLKPENLRVIDDPYSSGDRREIVKIYDFGIAHVAEAAAACTQAGALVGTPYYMSPEQAAAAPVAPQSDLYACGVIMFLLATGELPFVADSPIEVASMHIREPPPLPSSKNPGIDPRLEAIILHCLAKRPRDRPRSGVELAAMLNVIAESSGRAETAPSRTMPEPFGIGRRQAFHSALLPWTTAWAIGATSALGTMLADQWIHTSWEPGTTEARTCIPDPSRQTYSERPAARPPAAPSPAEPNDPGGATPPSPDTPTSPSSAALRSPGNNPGF
jgi:eukaryotic-like serine/threonine-protein kinase